jgi:acyl-CoA thioesterase I
MHRSRLIALLLFLALPGSVMAEQPIAISPACDAPEEFSTPEDSLDQFAAALKSGDVVHVLAIGSGTTVGEVNGTPGTSFPYRMVEALRAARPKVSIDLTVRGGRNMTAEEMLPLLEAEVHRRHYALVLWQTGTVEAVRGLRPDGMRSVLQAGVDTVREAGGDVVLIDQQFSRFLRANTDLDPYVLAMQQIAMLPGVVLFHRFELMRSWVGDGHIDLERVKKADRETAVTTLNICLGQMLARFVLNGAEDASR